MLSSPGELLSYKEFFKNGIRQSTNKTEFQFFLPAFICPQHAVNNKNWIDTFKELVLDINKSTINVSKKEVMITVLPKIINSMIVEMKKCEKA